jgi:hypothetical protein
MYYQDGSHPNQLLDLFARLGFNSGFPHRILQRVVINKKINLTKGEKMKRIKSMLVCFSILMMFTVNASAIESLVNTVVEGCETELKAYCSNVTVGEGRVIACLYAHGDKLSGKCEYALYDAATQLERFVATLSYLAKECKNDLEEYCSSVRAGEGRLIECLNEKKNKISNRCNQAIKDVGLE